MSGNDEVILKLKDAISKKKEELSRYPQNFISETSCVFIDENGDKKNLRVLDEESLVLLKVKINMYKMSAYDLNLPLNKICISGFSIDKWLHDINCRIDEIRCRIKEADLKKDEQLLDSLLSEDKKTEIMLNKIAERLGM